MPDNYVFPTHKIPNSTRDISAEVLDANGRMRVLPASFWAATTRDERANLGHLNGIYSFPTIELVELLKDRIAGRKTIEIGAGHGVLAEALGIPATDSKQQEQPKYAAVYKAANQPTIRYGDNVIEMPASRAVRIHRPEVVIGCWVTHKWRRDRPQAGGNEKGIDEEEVLRGCQEYIFIGNEKTHQAKPILQLEHTTEYPTFVYSRSHHEAREFIATWRGSGR